MLTLMTPPPACAKPKWLRFGEGRSASRTPRRFWPRAAKTPTQLRWGGSALSGDVEQLRRRAAQHRHLLLVAERIAGEDVVDWLELPGIGIVAAQHDLAGADLGREMADGFRREDQRIEVELLEVLRRFLLERDVG